MIPPPFQIKICGVTTADDALTVARAGADAIGLNFYPASKRFVTLEQASAIAASVSAEMVKVGVFVNASAGEIREAAVRVGLDLIQLHGDEPAEMTVELADFPIVKAVRWSPGAEAAAERYFDRCARLGGRLAGLLIDAPCGTEYGGTGQTTDWPAIARWRQQRSGGVPIVLAGGLTPANVAAAIATVRPAAVDTASGVEFSPGRKDPRSVADFVTAARQSFAATGAA